MTAHTMNRGSARCAVLRRLACQQDRCDFPYRRAAQHGMKCKCECRAKSKLRKLTRDTVDKLWGLYSGQGPRFEGRSWIACGSCLKMQRRHLAAVRPATLLRIAHQLTPQSRDNICLVSDVPSASTECHGALLVGVPNPRCACLHAHCHPAILLRSAVQPKQPKKKTQHFPYINVQSVQSLLQLQRPGGLTPRSSAILLQARS